MAIICTIIGAATIAAQLMKIFDLMERRPKHGNHRNSNAAARRTV